MFERAMEKQEAWAAAISCSGFDPGPSSNRDLNVYPPLMVSPAVKVPVPVGTSPFHSALPFAGTAPSSLDHPVVHFAVSGRSPDRPIAGVIPAYVHDSDPPPRPRGELIVANSHSQLTTPFGPVGRLGRSRPLSLIDSGHHVVAEPNNSAEDRRKQEPA